MTHFNNQHKIIRGDIFLVDLGEDGKGSEHKGIRPAVVIQNNIGNTYSPTLIVAIISSRTTNKKMPTHIPIGAESGLTQPSVVMVEQVRTISKERIEGYIGRANKITMDNIDKAIQISLHIGEGRMKNYVEAEIDNMVHKLHEIDIIISTLRALQSVDISVMEELTNKQRLLFNRLDNYCNAHKLNTSHYYVRSIKK